MSASRPPLKIGSSKRRSSVVRSYQESGIEQPGSGLGASFYAEKSVSVTNADANAAATAPAEGTSTEAAMAAMRLGGDDDIYSPDKDALTAAEKLLPSEVQESIQRSKMVGHALKAMARLPVQVSAHDAGKGMLLGKGWEGHLPINFFKDLDSMEAAYHCFVDLDAIPAGYDGASDDQLDNTEGGAPLPS